MADEPQQVNEQQVRRYCQELARSIQAKHDVACWTRIQDGRLFVGIEEVGVLSHDLVQAVTNRPEMLVERVVALVEGRVTTPWVGTVLYPGDGAYPLDAWTDKERAWHVFLRDQVAIGRLHEGRLESVVLLPEGD